MSVLFDAIERRDLDQVKRVLTRANVNERNPRGSTPLHRTVLSDAPEIAEYLLTHGADVNARGQSDETPLHTAACRDRKEIAKTLLAHGASVNAKDSRGLTPLQFAQESKYEEMIQLITNPPPRVASGATSAQGGGFFAFFRRFFGK